MNRICRAVLPALFLGLIVAGACQAEVEGRLLRKIQLQSPPVDMAVSQKGSYIFSLTAGGTVEIYSPDGSMLDALPVGDGVDQIQAGPRDDLILLRSSKDQTVQILLLDFVQDIDVSGSPSRGPEDAPVTIVVFSDFQCPYCAKVPSLLDEVQKRYPERVRLVFKNFPLGSHKMARPAAVAALAAEMQGQFWPFHDRLFESQKQLSDEKIDTIAKDLGLDMNAFEKARKSPALVARVNRDFQQGQKHGVRGTPTIFVNGRRLENRSVKEFEQAIEQELSRKATAASQDKDKG